MASPLAPLAARFRALPRNQQLAIAFGVPIAFALGFAYLTWQVMGQLGADREIPPLLQREGLGVWAEIAGVEDQITEKQKVIDKKPQIEAQLAELQNDIAAAEQRLPREAEKAQMREVIERLAREIPQDLGQVKVRSVRIIEDQGSAAATKKSSLKTVTYQTEVAGDLNGLIKYIDSIEKNTRFMMVNTIALKGGGVKADPEAKGKIIQEPHTVRMDLVTYVYSGGKGKAP